jgi:hypothetical protein
MNQYMPIRSLAASFTTSGFKKEPISKKKTMIFPPDKETSHGSKIGSKTNLGSQMKKNQGPNIDQQFGLSLSNGVSLKPKFKRIKNLSSGSTSILFNANNRKFPSEKEIDLDLEQLKLKVCLRKEINYENIKLDEDAKNNDNRRKFNEKKRKKLITKIRDEFPSVATMLKNNAKILNNWVAYVVR